MAEQLAGAASVAVVVLAWLLVVEAMTAAIVLLATFTVLQWRALRSLLTVEPPRAVPVAVPAGDQDQGDGEAPRVRIGGGVMRWH
jgi:hypothetical protein